MKNKNILISGAGIAGTTLAYWLKKFGFNPTIVEISPTLREGGYAIDFMGAGYDIAEKMGIITALQKADLNMSKLSFVDSSNNEKGSMSYQKMKKALNNRAFTLLRSDLAKVIYNSLDKETGIIFGDTIDTIEQDDEKVIITFKSGKTRSFDLLIGADGLHSNVRNLIFGKESQFEKYLGYYTSSYTFYNQSLKDRSFSMYSVPKKQVSEYNYSEEKTAAFFVFNSPEKLHYEHHDIKKQKQILKEQFMNIGWKCSELLSKIDSTCDFYFDAVSQIKMEHWSKGRVALVGDACDCPSLISGKGSTLAMAGAYILAGELKRANGNYTSAFTDYQKIMKPFMEAKQKSAQSFAKTFVPNSNFGIWIRNQGLKLMSIPFITKRIFKQFEDKDLKLREY